MISLFFSPHIFFIYTWLFVTLFHIIQVNNLVSGSRFFFSYLQDSIQLSQFTQTSQ